MMAKYASNGRAIRATSSGRAVMAWPCRANRITMVNNGGRAGFAGCRKRAVSVHRD